VKGIPMLAHGAYMRKGAADTMGCVSERCVAVESFVRDWIAVHQPRFSVWSVSEVVGTLDVHIHAWFGEHGGDFLPIAGQQGSEGPGLDAPTKEKIEAWLKVVAERAEGVIPPSRRH
jgi:hypothetical protein